MTENTQQTVSTIRSAAILNALMMSDSVYEDLVRKCLFSPKQPTGSAAVLLLLSILLKRDLANLAINPMLLSRIIEHIEETPDAIAFWQLLFPEDFVPNG